MASAEEIRLDTNGVHSGGRGESSNHDRIERRALLDSDDSSAESNEEWMRKYISVECKDEH